MFNADKLSRIGVSKLLAALLGIGTLAVSAQQPYPQRPVRMVVPFAAGGTTDTIGRFIAKDLGERLGQSVVVENRGGGGGVVGTEVAARSQPDGYNILLASAESFGMTDGILKRLNYNPEKDLLPVTMISRAPNTFTVHPSVKANSLKELIDFARANPGKLRYGTPGIGSNPHLIGELFKSRFKADITHVPYKGGGNGIVDAVSGEIEVILTGINTAAPRVKAGQLRTLAITGSSRSPLLPGVPTMAEAGAEDFVLGALFGIYVPAGTPAVPIGRLQKELAAVAGVADFRNRLIEVGQEPAETLQGEAFGKYMLAEARRWRDLARAAGVKDE
ncbi:MAG: Bug family tripartite tricarboxylate transporter substrate binding protein [Burkholderiales bacterium]